MALPDNWPNTGTLEHADGTSEVVELAGIEERLTRDQLTNVTVVIDGQKRRPWRFCSIDPHRVVENGVVKYYL